MRVSSPRQGSAVVGPLSVVEMAYLNLCIHTHNGGEARPMNAGQHQRSLYVGSSLTILGGLQNTPT